MKWNAVLGFLLILSLSRCGIATYPGQPGFASNNYSRIDMEYLDEAGLFFYEVSYDNRPGGAGVGAIVTKLYPGARTYTSNVRTNADGTLMRAKAQYDGAKVQTISMPKLNQIYVAPDNKVQFLLDYEDSLDEVDDANVAEKGIFNGVPTSLVRLTTRAWDKVSQKFQLLKAATLHRDGSLAYAVTEVSFGTEKWKPAAPVNVETTLALNAVRAELTADLRKELSEFIETKFPKGFKGTAALKVMGATAPLSFRVGVHTMKTAQAAGIKMVSTLSHEDLSAVLGGVQ